MNKKLGLGIGLAALVLLPSIGLAQKQQTERARTDRQEADRARVLAKIFNFAMTMQNVTPAKLAVDVEAQDYLAVTVTNGQGEQRALEFEANQTSDCLRPILAEGTEGEIFGREFFGFGLDGMLAYDAAKIDGNPPKEELLPFDAMAAQQPHDDVSVFVVDEELVLIRLWNGGRLLGTYYAVDMDAAMERFEAAQAELVESGEAVGMRAMGPIAPPTKKDIICGRMEKWCLTGSFETKTVLACGIWLYFCD